MLIFRGILSVIVATILLVITTFIPNTAMVTYSDIMGCEEMCKVVATGYPLPFIVDYPGLSPVNSVNIMGVLMGWDKVIHLNLVISFFFFLIVGILIINSLWKTVSRDS